MIAVTEPTKGRDRGSGKPEVQGGCLCASQCHKGFDGMWAESACGSIVCDTTRNPIAQQILKPSKEMQQK